MNQAVIEQPLLFELVPPPSAETTEYFVNPQSFKLMMEPVAKGRGRVGLNRHTNRPVVFTPAETARAERSFRALLVAQSPRMIGHYVPVVGVLKFFVSKPPSLPKKRGWPVTRPDLDNLEKLVKDACNGLLWTDDAQVVAIAKRKYYCADGEPPRIELQVWEVTSTPPVGNL